MNVQPKPSPECTKDPYAPMRDPEGGHRSPHIARTAPAGPRLFVTWPVEFEVDPWRP